jgi:hypothetical protein
MSALFCPTLVPSRTARLGSPAFHKRAVPKFDRTHRTVFGLNMHQDKWFLIYVNLNGAKIGPNQLATSAPNIVTMQRSAREYATSGDLCHRDTRDQQRCHD